MFKYNHCTVQVYSGDNNNGRLNSSFAFHSDCIFDHKMGNNRRQVCILSENSVFLLHPEDEILFARHGDNNLSQYVYTGVNVTNKNELSVAFAFRVVCVDQEYDPITSKLILKATDIRS